MCEADFGPKLCAVCAAVDLSFSDANQGPAMYEDSNARADVAALIQKGDGLLSKLFSALTAETGDELLSHAKLRNIPAGTVILENGQISAEIGYVIDGIVGMIQVVDHSRRHIVGLLVPTDIYGRLFDGPGSFRLEALSPTRILSFPREPFEQILRAHPEVERLFLVHLLDEMDAAREWLLLISGRKVVNRVASFLTILARRARSAGRPWPVTLHLPLNRKDLAHYLGTRRESLSRAFHELENRGILRIINAESFEVPDLQALMDASGDDLTVDEG